MSLFSQRKNKTFKFPSRQKSTSHDSIESKWEDIKQNRSVKSKKSTPLVLFIIGIIVFVILFYVLNNYEK